VDLQVEPKILNAGRGAVINAGQTNVYHGGFAVAISITVIASDQISAR